MPSVSRNPHDAASQPEQSAPSLSKTLSVLRSDHLTATSASSNSRAVGRALLTLQRSDRLRRGDLGIEP